jgi:TonB family protein
LGQAARTKKWGLGMTINFLWLITAVAAQMPSINNEVAPPPPPPTNAPVAVPKGNPGFWVNTDDYPSHALRNELEGTVAFTLEVGVNGRVDKCTVTLSTGYEVLDSSTCSNIRRRARFDPALNEEGYPVPGKYSNRVRWVLPKGGRDIPPIANIGVPPNTIDGSTGWTPEINVGILPARTAPYSTSYKLRIAANGVPTACKPDGRYEPDPLIAKRQKLWDNYACQKALANRRFIAAKDVAGNAVLGTYYGYIRWPEEHRPLELPFVAPTPTNK